MMEDRGPAAEHGRHGVGRGTVQGQRTVVLNRTEANNDLDRAEVEDIIGVGAAVQLPYDAALIATSVNAGTPFVLMETQAQATRRIRDLAAALRIIDPLPETAPAGVDDAEIEVSGELAWRHHLGNVSRR